MSPNDVIPTRSIKIQLDTHNALEIYQALSGFV